MRLFVAAVIVLLAEAGAFVIGSRTAHNARPVPVGAAIVSTIGLGTDAADACVADTTLETNPSTIWAGLHLTGARPGLLVTLAVNGPDGIRYVRATVARGQSDGCVVLGAPASIDGGTIWPDGEYSISAWLGSPAQASGPVVAFTVGEV